MTKPTPATLSELAARPTRSELNRLFDYDPETGTVRYRVQAGPRGCVGERAGSLRIDGYRSITISRRKYQETHIIWTMMTGQWPDETIDHIDRVTDNNRWANLRQATRGQQVANTKLRKNNVTGVRGVFWHKRDRLWLAKMGFNGKHKSLGYFETKEAAAEAYHVAATKRWGDYYHDARNRSRAALAKLREARG